MLEDRFTSKFTVDGSDCWTWRAATDRKGYGVYMRARAEIRQTGEPRRVAAHRYAYRALVGLIPDGLVLDHLCRNPACVNPAHLEPVTLAENLRRGAGVGMALWDEQPNKNPLHERTHCRHGHEYTPENTYYDPQRRCRECSRIRMRRIGPPKPRTHCKHGHELTDDNSIVGPDGYRRCRICNREAVKRYQQRSH